jgi:proteasome lid subunit RPN8/RPN11
MNEQSREYKSPDTELKFLEELVREETVASNTYKITKGAFNKAMTYAKAIGQLAGTGMECYGYLLKPSDGLDNTVTDIFLAPNQTNQSAYVRVSAEGVYQSSQEIEPKGMMIVGWWHSHGTFSTFHSGTDVHNFEVVLHSIAPRTMYRNEKGQYTYNAQTKELLVNGTKIKGLELPEDSQLEVIRKVEQDPYAYSMVVNMYRSCYLEKITKKLISREEGFVLNPPSRPALELVNAENDVKYTISEIEDDITSKVEITNGFSRFGNGSYNGYNNNSFKKSTFDKQSSTQKIDWLNINKANKVEKVDPHTNVISQFVEKFKNGTPEYLNDFVDGLLKQEKSVLLKLNESSTNSQAVNTANTAKKVDLEELSAVLTERFENVAEKYASNDVYDIQRLRDEMAWHFVSDYAADSSHDVVKKFIKLNSVISNNFDVAVNAGKALAKYSMERFTDYNNECKHKYKNFIGHFLDNMNTKDYVPISASLKMSKNSRYDQATDRLFLYNDRLDIINNMLTTLSFKSDELKFKPFLNAFAEEYQKDPASEKLDSIIEKKLLSTLDNGNFSSYADRASYERKGVLGKIFSEVKNYFGGVKNVGYY